MPRVLLDVDGVLADFVATYLEALALVTNRRRYAAEITTWSFKDALGLSKEVEGKVNAQLAKEGVASAMPVYSGAVKGVKSLTGVAEVYFVTSPFNSPTWTYDREKWLLKHFGEEMSRRVVHTSQKHLVKGDVFVDDKTANVRRWAKEWPLGTPVLWNQPYNQSDHVGYILRCGVWDQICNIAQLYKGNST